MPSIRLYIACADQWVINDYAGTRVCFRIEAASAMAAALGLPPQTVQDVAIIGRINRNSYNERLAQRKSGA